MNTNRYGRTAPPDTPWQRWLDRYGDHYRTDAERREAYRHYRAELAAIRRAFYLAPAGSR